VRASACTGDSAESARSILDALRAADLPALDDALRRSAELLPPPPGLPAGEAERRELLAAVSQQFRRSLSRVRRRVSRRLEEIEVLPALLAHLARRPPHPIALRVR